jgi:hypothetical protein
VCEPWRRLTVSSASCAGKVVAILAREGSVSMRKVRGSSLATVVE